MKTLFITLLTLLALGTNAQTVINNQIIIGRVDRLHSKILNEERKIWVYLPSGITNTSTSNKHYPVVYLLDGDTHFASFTGMLQRLSASGKCPEMIVIGILNTDRLRDLTPTNSLLMDDGSKADFLKISGGGEKFTAFIKDELMPHVDSIYPTEGYKMLVGHSLGGLMAVDMMANHSKMFNAYVVIDPSLWWDHRIILKQTIIKLKTDNYQNIAMYMGIANTFSPDMDSLKATRDTTVITEHFRSIIALDKAIKDNKANGLIYKSAYYPGDAHDAVPLVTEFDALNFIFNYYPFSAEEKLSMQNIPDEKAVILSEHYKVISKRMGYAIFPPEIDIQLIAMDLLKKGNTAKAHEAFMIDLTNYPNSFAANDGMGDYYSFIKDKPNALIYYKKALKIKDDAETKKKLAAL